MRGFEEAPTLKKKCFSFLISSDISLVGCFVQLAKAPRAYPGSRNKLAVEAATGMVSAAQGTRHARYIEAPEPDFVRVAFGI